jgi:hypothetical protein
MVTDRGMANEAVAVSDEDATCVTLPLSLGE